MSTVKLQNRGCHDDVIEWKPFPPYWPFVRGNHRPPVNSPHKGQWRGAFGAAPGIYILAFIWPSQTRKRACARPLQSISMLCRVVQEKYGMAVLWPQFSPHGRQGSCAVGVRATISYGQRNQKHPRSIRGQSFAGSAGTYKTKPSRNETNNTNNSNKISSPNCQKLPTSINRHNLKKCLQGYNTAQQFFSDKQFSEWLWRWLSAICWAFI